MSDPDLERQERERAAARERYYRNREKRIAQAKVWRDANRDRVRETDTARRQGDLDRYNARQRDWRERNPDKANASYKAWKQRNPDAVAAMRRSRRARVRGANGSVTKAEWRDRLELFSNRCAYCGADGPLEMEHMVPLSRGGEHTASNVAPSCVPCNRSKGSLTVPEFLARRQLSKGSS